MPDRSGNAGIFPRQWQAIRSLGSGDQPVLQLVRIDAGIEIRHRPGANRLTDTVTVGIFTDHRPAVSPPPHRLEVDDPAIGFLVLEMQEPVLTGRRIDPGALVRTIDGARRRCHDDFFFIRSQDVVRTQDGLPTRRNAARRRKQVILPVPFVQFGPFYGRLGRMSVVDNPGRTQQTGAVRCHRRHQEDALQPGSRTGQCM